MKAEVLRDNCNNLRDRAMIDFLLSTGIRVGELVRLNIDDIDFSERECIVSVKGEILEKLEKSREHAAKGMYRDATDVSRNMRAKYGI